MNTRLKTIFEILEVQRQALLSEVKALSAEQFNTHPPGKWSINQILAHLIAAERVSLLYVRKKILAVNEVRDTGLWEETKMLLLSVSQRLPGLKFTAPKVIVDHTPSYRDYGQLEREWSKLRVEWREFLEGIPDAHVKRKIFRHVFAGRLNIGHGLLFLRGHIIHHLPQVRRLSKTG